MQRIFEPIKDLCESFFITQRTEDTQSFTENSRVYLKFFVTISILTISWLACGNAVNREPREQAEKIIYYQLGETQIPIHIHQFGDKNEFVFINVHDNEFTSVEAALPVLQKTGGLLIRIENDGERVIRFRFRGSRFGFDPNRMFSDTGILETMKDQGRFDEAAAAEIDRFAERFLSLIPANSRYLVALHNNTNGGFSINSYQAGGEYEKDALKIHRNPKEDPDDLVLTTNEKIYRVSVKLGYNSILQDNLHATRDGSLSIWAGENNWKYLNLETEHGKMGKYREMLSALVKKLD